MSILIVTSFATEHRFWRDIRCARCHSRKGHSCRPVRGEQEVVRSCGTAVIVQDSGELRGTGTLQKRRVVTRAFAPCLEQTEADVGLMITEPRTMERTLEQHEDDLGEMCLS